MLLSNLMMITSNMKVIDLLIIYANMYYDNNFLLTIFLIYFIRKWGKPTEAAIMRFAAYIKPMYLVK